MGAAREHSLAVPDCLSLIAKWYATRYGASLYPESEVLGTHGGVEVITLALLTVTESPVHRRFSVRSCWRFWCHSLKGNWRYTSTFLRINAISSDLGGGGFGPYQDILAYSISDQCPMSPLQYH
jgi:hypothetical protein